MVITLRDSIKQKKPFASGEHEAYLNVLRTAAALEAEVEQLLKPHGLTCAQFNVLRILRGAEADGLCRNAVRDRMITRMPDMTRLLDRMEAAGLVERTRSVADRRHVATHITLAGRKLLDKVNGPVNELHKRQLGHLTQKQLGTLSELLTLARQEP
jgi:DNA-binding MarR family transcriptional regulator